MHANHQQQSTQNVWVEFEHEERAFKEEVAQAKELAAEKKVSCVSRT